MADLTLPPGYSRHERRGETLILLDACRDALLEFFDSPVAVWRTHPEARPYAGKGRHFSVPLPRGAGRVFVRVWTHGGAVAWLGGRFPNSGRAVEELRALVTARAAGADVPEPLAVRIERRAIGCRLMTLTREIEGAVELPVFLGAFDAPPEPERTRRRRLVARAFGEAVGRLHRAGVFPLDLHLRNVLVQGGGDDVRVRLVDLDPVAVLSAADARDSDVAAHGRADSLGRLYRSAVRWRRAGLRIPAPDLSRFGRTYAAASGAVWKVKVEGRASPAGTVRDARGVTWRGTPEAVERPCGVLFRMPNWLGDAVMAMPLLEGARRRWPEAGLAVLTEGKFRDLYALSPVPVEVLAYGPGGAAAALETARGRRFDLAICVPRSFGSARLTAGCGAPVRVGFDGFLRGRCFTHRVRVRRAGAGRHRVETFWALGAPLGFGPFPPPPRLAVPDDAAREARELLVREGIREGERIVGLNPGAAYGPAKQWPIERFLDAAESLAGRPRTRLLLFGSAAESKLAEALRIAVGESAVSVAGRTSLPLLAALIARCDAFVTNDTGPMHVAAALGVPVVAVFGSTDSVATGPYGCGHRVVETPTPCAPCLLRACPIDFRCMWGVEAARVAGAVDRIAVRAQG